MSRKVINSTKIKKFHVKHTYKLNSSTCFEMDCKIYFVKKNYDLFRITAFCLFGLTICLSCIWPCVSSTVICPLYGPLPVYGPLSPLWSSARLQPSVSSIALFPSMTLCPLFCPLSPLQPFSPLWPSFLSKALSSLQPSGSSTALCPLYGPFFPSQPSCLHYGPLKTAKEVKKLNTFRQNLKRYRDYRFSEKFCNNRDNHIQQEAISVFRKKLKSPFRINPIASTAHVACRRLKALPPPSNII